MLAGLTGERLTKGPSKLPSRNGGFATGDWESRPPIAPRDPAACPDGIRNRGTIIFVHDAETKIELADYAAYSDANAWMRVHTVSDLIEGLRSYVGTCGVVSGIQIEAHGGERGKGGFRMGDDTDQDGHVEGTEAFDMVSTQAQATKFGQIIKNALRPGGFVAITSCRGAGPNNVFIQALHAGTGGVTLGSQGDTSSGSGWWHKSWWEAGGGRVQVNADGTVKTSSKDEGNGMWRPF